MFKQKILLNSVTSLLQMFLTAIIVFFQYRYLYKTLGVSNLGIWSIVLSVNFFLGVSGFGMQGSIVKYVSKYYTKNDIAKTTDIIQTALLSMLFFSLIGTLIAYPLTLRILKYTLDSSSYFIAVQILPIAFVSFVVSMLSSITTSALDGLNRMYIKNILLIVISIIIFILILFATPVWGLTGLTCIKLIESVLILLASFIMTKKCLPSVPVLPVKWNSNVFKEIIGYSLKFQVISFSIILSDPLVKMLLSKFGGVAYVGIYELANKMVFQVRSLIVSAYQTLVPAVASYHETEPHKIKDFYISSYKLLFFICMAIFTLLIVSAPIISRFWIGEVNKRFIFLLLILAGAWLINSLAIAAYFTNMGTGNVNDNVVAHIIVGLVNLGAGLLLGIWFGGNGVAIAIAIAITAGGIYQLIFFHLRNRLIKEIFPKENRGVAIFCFLFTITFIILLIQKINSTHFLLLNSVILFTGMIAFSVIVLKNKVFTGIVAIISSKLGNLIVSTKRNAIQ